MVDLRKIFGRLGNNLFQFAFLYAYARDAKTDYYFQNPEYFAGYEDEIRQLFGSDIVPIDMVAIHCRRGDYVNNPFYVDLTKTDYYERAMKLFPQAQFLVFSDDIEWCKKFFIGNEFDFSEGKTDVEDLNLMSGCKGLIMANSSLSWWASFLNCNKDAKIVAPSVNNWYSDGVERTKCPPEWIRL